MYKFFVKENQIRNNVIEIKGNDVNHIKNVLRLRKDDEIIVCNTDEEKSYNCKIIKIEEDTIQAIINGEIENSIESNVKIHLFQGLPKFEKMELIIEKCIELGVSKITPVEMKRCVVKLDEKNKIKKVERWNKIAEVAAKQSKRDIIPKVCNVTKLNNIFKIVNEYDIVLLAYENEENNTLKNELKKINMGEDEIKIGIIIGPEGGIDSEELKEMENNNIKIITLGKRILRTETAPIAMVANIMYEFERNENFYE